MPLTKKVKITAPVMVRGESPKVGSVVDCDEKEAMDLLMTDRGVLFSEPESRDPVVETRDPKIRK